MILTGLDRLDREEALAAQIRAWGRVALVTHATTVSSSGRAAVRVVDDALRRSGADGQGLVAVLGPQHGYWQCEPYNMIETPDGVLDLGDGRRLPLYSLYGEHREPSARHLEGVDTVVVDLPDIGCRIYTYMTTLAGCLRAAARHGKRVVVLDRPNPLGLAGPRQLPEDAGAVPAGQRVEGNIIASGLMSFVGWFAIPMRHGLTLGELGKWFLRQDGLEQRMASAFEVVPVSGLSRSSVEAELFAASPRMASPNMPGPWTMAFFPIAVPLEGCNVSEGRGTTAPFQSIGAPFLEETRLCRALDEAAAKLKCSEDVAFRPHRFAPSFDKFAGQVCRGVFLQSRSYVPETTFAWSVALLAALCRAGGAQFSWRAPGYEYNFEACPIDLILGDSRWRPPLEALTREDSCAAWDELSGLLEQAQVQAHGFVAASAPFWIYGSDPHPVRRMA